MELRFAPRGLVEFEEASIKWRNFSGAAKEFNSEGDRNFHIVIPDRELRQAEVDSFLDIYRDAAVVDVEDGPVLMFEGQEIITVADALNALGWNVKFKAPREEGDSGSYSLKVKVKFNDRGPLVQLISGNAINDLDERQVGSLDFIDITFSDIVIRPYDWETAMGSGRTAYLQKIYVNQEVDRFAEKYRREEYPEE